ncbi:peptidoglycan-associated lipoprotein [Sphingomonas sp. F9_3S_D5_B_2]
MGKPMLFAAAAVALASGSAAAQLRVPHIVQRGMPGQPSAMAPMLQGIDALRSEFIAQSGSANVYFGADSAVIGVPARATLAAQAQWLLRHPEVVVRIEGYADPIDTRDHGLAVGARRADAVRDYLVLLGVPAMQVSAASFGKERAGPGRAVTILVR